MTCIAFHCHPHKQQSFYLLLYTSFNSEDKKNSTLQLHAAKENEKKDSEKTSESESEFRPLKLFSTMERKTDILRGHN